MIRNLLLYACVVLAIAACTPQWKYQPESEIVTETTYRVDLPAGWMRYSASKETLIISHDGPALQSIEICVANHKEAFKKINETSTSDILPSELAELTLAMIKNQLPASRVVLLENKPVKFASRQGFRLHIKYETAKGLDYEGIITGLATEKKVYMIKYYGTSLHYFPRDLPVYEELVNSFQIIDN